MDDDLKPEDFINHRERFSPPKIVQPKYDSVVTQVVGKPVMNQDPRLLKLILKFKARKSDADAPDNFFQNPHFIKELKEVFSKPL